MAAPVVLAIDGNSLVHRSYHAQAHTAAVTEGGRPNWAVRGLLTQLVAAVDRIGPSLVVVGFDDPSASTRRDTWPTYKANRSEKLETLVEQLAGAVTVLRELGVAVVVPPGLEADDVLASTAALARSAGGSTVIVTSDRDSFSLIDDTTSVLRIINGGVEASPLLTPERLMLLLGVRPEQYRDFAALRGDPSDNLPGVRGIGPRSGAQLLAEFGSAQAAFDDLDGVRTRVGAGVAKRLAEPGAREAWALNCQIMTMRCDLELGLDLTADCTGTLPLDAEAVSSTFHSLNLTWSLSDALRTLAHVEPATPRPPRTIATPWASGSWSDPSRTFAEGSRPGHRAARTRPKAPPSRPKVQQLSLFD
ncbi:5'-3' exonuclease H3TH domain-containing protein [Jatrophihabitans sp.]|uniref:5'-3' exonuclease n=1 Tax=Jatrophihabitans sp. TaxID=1932789 RepID=UPI0030C6700A|nr:polymerase [Jatrophihabitans sp.]